MMIGESTSYQARRGELKTYFDRTAIDAWKKFATEAPLGRIRETVRRGRTAMRETILARLPQDLTGWRILDAGCGTGAMSLALAARGAQVVGVDLSPETIRFAAERAPVFSGGGSIRFVAGDMLGAEHGRFDAVVAMDSLIHYRTRDVVAALAALAARTDRAIVFTFAPRTAPLALMHAAGRLFPRGDRAPAIEPVAPAAIASLIATDPALQGFAAGETTRISSGFYTSQMMELVRP